MWLNCVSLRDAEGSVLQGKDRQATESLDVTRIRKVLLKQRYVFSVLLNTKEASVALSLGGMLGSAK